MDLTSRQREQLELLQAAQRRAIQESNLISVPAGRSTRRSPNERWVDPQPDKGFLQMRLEDDLMHLWWKPRGLDVREDELIVFPGEATFEKVGQDSSGRTHVLKFSSSDQKYFFWFQRASTETDLRAEVDINSLLQDPTYRPGTAALPERAPAADAETARSPTPVDARSWPPTPGAPRLSHPEPAPPAEGSSSTNTQAAPAESTQPSEDQTRMDMARMLVEWAQQGGSLTNTDDDARLNDVLSPVNISTLLSTHPNLVSTIAPLLPSELNLPSNPSAQDLLPVLSAPQFTDAIASLENALRSGGLPGGMMRELGLPESAGTGVKAFLDALQALGTGDSPPQNDDDRMETD
ncbi:proteasome complex subunit Rpn13 ubiquitin receptor-domain-containing protein [Naematelia encephala]|uniref:Proteasome complex subunit Rpn13 ubiquitin receptor-domain-containing protein n=1 Tax=Naematelia encephala TaxID=71784 RepID=A0A1Y2BJ96_9TREE|nr:proteasome complex subunit Rpn13 ubiquitin receptor-domain-containing protein [Naematelia encephala]